MYYINPQVKGRTSIGADEFETFFPHLKDGKTLYMEKRDDDFYIETVLGGDELIYAVRLAEERGDYTVINMARARKEERIEKRITDELLKGSAFQNGKYRIYKHYMESGRSGFAEMLKKEYGLGGWTTDYGSSDHSAKGFRVNDYKPDNPEEHFDITIGWENAASRVAALIDKRLYLTEQETEEYNARIEDERLLEERKEPNEMYKRYSAVQAENPKAIVLQRVDDFWEVYGENAIRVADELDLTLVGRDVALEERVPMVGFPFHAENRYVSALNEKYEIVKIEPGQEPVRLPVFALEKEIEKMIDETDVEELEELLELPGEEQVHRIIEEQNPEHKERIRSEVARRIAEQDFPKDFEDPFTESLLDDVEAEKRTIEETTDKEMALYEREQEFLKKGGGKSGVYDTSDPSVRAFVLEYSEFIPEDQLYTRDKNNSLVSTTYAAVERAQEKAQRTTVETLKGEEIKKQQGERKMEKNNKNNYVKLQGVLTEVALNTSENGKQYSKAKISVGRNYGDESKSDVFEVVAFGETAEKLAAKQKGETVAVIGRIDTQRYNGRNKLSVIVSKVEDVQENATSANIVQLSGFVNNKKLEMKKSDGGKEYVTVALSVKNEYANEENAYQTLFVSAFGNAASRMVANYHNRDLISVQGTLQTNAENGLSIVAHRSELIRSQEQSSALTKTRTNENQNEQENN